MSDPAAGQHPRGSDFDRLYDLDDPSPYFTALRPLDYRMPAVLAGALEAMTTPLRAARGAGDVLKVLDFACGYGAIGALLRHALTLPQLYARYGERRWRPEEARRYWEADRAFFGARRRETPGFEIAGVDVAGAALAYAAAVGFVDRAFREDLVERAPGDGLTRFLQGVDLVVESGALGHLLPEAFRRILDCGGAARGPWFLYGLRPDVDAASLNGLWVERGFRIEALGAVPARYRKLSGEREWADVLRRTRALGRPDGAVRRDGYLLVEVTLVRPEADAENPPIAELRRLAERAAAQP